MGLGRRLGWLGDGLAPVPMGTNEINKHKYSSSLQQKRGAQLSSQVPSSGSSAKVGGYGACAITNQIRRRKGHL